MRESVERRRAIEAKRKQFNRDANLILACGLVILPVAVVMLFLPACDNAVAFLMLLHSFAYITFSNYIRNQV